MVIKEEPFVRIQFMAEMVLITIRLLQKEFFTKNVLCLLTKIFPSE